VVHGIERETRLLFVTELACKWRLGLVTG